MSLKLIRNATDSKCYSAVSFKLISNVMSTPVIPMLVVVMLTMVSWAQVINQFISNRGLVFVIALIAATGSLVGLFALQQNSNSRWQRNKICSRCGGQSKAVGGGNFDGAMPGPCELSIYAITVVVPVALWLIIETSR